MECHFLTFYGKEFSYDTIIKYLGNVTKPYRVITNNTEVHKILTQKQVDSINFADAFPEEGQLAEEIYKCSKISLEQYRCFFDGVSFREIDIFRGFEYQLLLQLSYIIKARKVLEIKKNTIFIFERFSTAYFAIMKIAAELGYHRELRIGLLRNNKIEFIKQDESNSSSYIDRTARVRLINFVNSLGTDNSLAKINIIRFAFIIISLSFKRFFKKLCNKKTNESILTILDKIDKKIYKTDSKYNTICAMFFTTARLDLFLRPIQPILVKFAHEGIPYHIFTTDIATSLVLSKENIPFVSFFEELNMLIEILRTSEEGKELKERIERRILQFHSLLGIEELMPDLLSKIYRAMATIVILDHIIGKMKLKSILDGGTGEVLENLAIEIAKKYKITSFSMVPSPPTPSPIFADWFHADRFFVEGSQGAEVMKSLGYDAKKILVVGGPRYDHFKKLDSIKSKAILEHKYKVSQKKKLVVIAMSRWHENDDVWVPNLIKFCNENNLEFVMKIHPTYKVASQNVSEGKIRSIGKKCNNLKYLMTYDIDLSLLLSAADLVITDWSSVGIEAVLLEKPLLTVNFTKEYIEPYMRYHEFQASLYVEDYEKLEKTISDILFKNMYLDELSNGRKRVMEKYNYLNDGKATERIFDLLITHPTY